MEYIKNNFDKIVTNYNGKCIVDFYTDWCGPCKLFSKVFEEVEELKKDIKFFKVNTDRNRSTAQKLGIMSIPTIILFENGKEIKRNIGFMSKENLIDFIGD